MGDEESLAHDPACPLDAGRCDICPGAVRLSFLFRVFPKGVISRCHLERVLGRVVEQLDTLIECLLVLDLCQRSCL